MKEMESIADETCACKDMACLANVQKKMAKATEKLNDANGTEADSKKLLEVMSRISSCIAKLASAPK